MVPLVKECIDRMVGKVTTGAEKKESVDLIELVLPSLTLEVGLCVCVCVCLCVCTCTCLHVCVCVCVLICIHVWDVCTCARYYSIIVHIIMLTFVCLLVSICIFLY